MSAGHSKYLAQGTLPREEGATTVGRYLGEQHRPRLLDHVSTAAAAAAAAVLSAANRG